MTNAIHCGYCLEPVIEPTSIWARVTQSNSEKVHTLACSHKFHYACVQEGVNEQIMVGLAKEGQPTCPACRKVFDFTSSTTKIMDMVKTAAKVAAQFARYGGFAAGYLTIHALASPLALGSVVAVAAARALGGIVGSLLGEIAFGYLWDATGATTLQNCIRLHNWQHGMKLEVTDLNCGELLNTEKAIIKHLTRAWIDACTDILDNFSTNPLHESYDLVAEITEEERDHLILQAVIDLVHNDPGTFALLKNNIHAQKSDAFEEAFDTSISQQLAKFGIIKLNERANREITLALKEGWVKMCTIVLLQFPNDEELQAKADLAPNMSEEDRNQLLEKAFDDLATSNPETFAILKNNVLNPEGEDFLDAFQISFVTQLLKFCILLPKNEQSSAE